MTVPSQEGHPTPDPTPEDSGSKVLSLDLVEDLNKYSMVTERDPRVVLATFWQGLGMDPHPETPEGRAAGWAQLKKEYPRDFRKWVKFRLQHEATAAKVADKPSTPWDGRPGWIEEPELKIKTKWLTPKRDSDDAPQEVPVEPGYELYNRLVTKHYFRPFRTDGGEVRVAIPTENGLEIGDPTNPGFKDAVGYSIFTLEGEPVPWQDLGVTTMALTGRAQSRTLPSERVVRLWLRVAPNGPFSSRVDLVDARWRCVVLRPEGWTLESVGHPVFDRRRHMLPLPDPARAPLPAGDPSRVEKLWEFVLLPSYPLVPGDDQRLLALTVLVQFLISPGTPKSVVVFPGDEGIGKSSSSLRLGQVIDPSLTPQIPPEEDEKELGNLTANRAVINFDNLSKIDSRFSDYLARLSTGTSQAKRLLYSNGDEVVTRMLPQLIINGITATPQAADLLRRSVFLNVVPPPQAIPREQLDARWELLSSEIFGGLLDLSCAALRVLRDAPPELSDSRMADFVRIGQAVALARGQTAGVFQEAWKVNCDRQHSAGAANPWVGVLYDYWSVRTPVSEPIASVDIARWINENAKHVFGRTVDAQSVGSALAKAKTTLARMAVFVGKKTVHGIPRYYRMDGPEVRQEPVKQLTLPGLLEIGSPASPSPPNPQIPDGAASGEASKIQGEAPAEGHPISTVLGDPTPQGSPEGHPQPHPSFSDGRTVQGEAGDPLSKVGSGKTGGSAPAGPPLSRDASPLREESFNTGPPTAGSGRAASLRRTAGDNLPENDGPPRGDRPA